MITEQDLQEAIAECQGQRNPNANTCIKLAAFYILKDHLFPDPTKMVDQFADAGKMVPAYSYAAAPVDQAETYIDYQGDSEFSRAIGGRNAAEIWAVMDELMTTLQAVYPRLYAGVMRQLEKE